jgi:hypothetical protein
MRIEDEKVYFKVFFLWCKVELYEWWIIISDW